MYYTLYHMQYCSMHSQQTRYDSQHIVPLDFNKLHVRAGSSINLMLLQSDNAHKVHFK